MSFGIRLRKSRMRKHWTQERLAEAVGVRQQAIQRIEAGKVKSSRRTTKLAQVLEVCPKWLAEGPGNDPIPPQK